MITMKDIIAEAKVKGQNEPFDASDVDVDFMIRELDYEIKKWEKYLGQLKTERTVLANKSANPVESMEKLSKLFKEMARVGKNKSSEYMKSFKFAKGK